MNCQEALDLLYDILDREASEIDTAQVQAHLQNCRHCFDRYRIEGDIHAFIREKLAHTQPTVHVESLRIKILSQLDSIDREEGAATGRKPPFWNTSFALAAAALLVIALGAAFLVAGLYRHQKLYLPLEQAHWTVEKQPTILQNTDETNSALAFAADTVGYQVNDAVMDYRMVGGDVELIEGARMAHFLYADNTPTADDDVVSVFVVSADQFSIPSNLNKTRINHNGFDFFDHHCRGCRLMYHRVGNAIIITATTNHDADLLDFVPGQSSI